MVDDRTTALLRALLYPVQFEKEPERGTDRVLERVVARNALRATPSEYLQAIRYALDESDESGEELAEIVPESHSGGTIRSYLAYLEQQLLSRYPRDEWEDDDVIEREAD